MRTLFILLCFIISINLSSQTDSTIYQTKRIIISYNKENNKYLIQNSYLGDTIENIKFIGQIDQYFQVLDSNNQIYYYNEKIGITDTVLDTYSVSLTVEQYELSILEIDDEYQIRKDETYYEYYNKKPLTIAWANINEVDSLVFINGQSTFNYSANFNSNPMVIVDPTTVIMCKDNKYQILNGNNIKYDWVSVFTEKCSYNNIKTRKNGLYGYYGIVEPKYQYISEFKFFLAKITQEDGTAAYIDNKGKEY